ncbi:hypothetical protein BU23DRAFT_628255 [Bimuria novae-zelandiae CBS 107.79]|uniref:Uncharacterized protein n=1 Tax=Bimuria novae-zelandiae CBS 107.79 TaxID=1447943 RepID=A0A6A5VTM7_9PLEO|nr:hypothetical protein BU23DRAFT_628255 [Bimuria novae-zelandiae CBS 107.79]
MDNTRLDSSGEGRNSTDRTTLTDDFEQRIALVVESVLSVTANISTIYPQHNQSFIDLVRESAEVWLEVCSQRYRTIAVLPTETKDVMRELRDLIRHRYALDIEIWKERGAKTYMRYITKTKMTMADAALRRIQELVKNMDRRDNFATEMEYEKFKEIKGRIFEEGKRDWERNPPWMIDGASHPTQGSQRIKLKQHLI